MKRPIPSPAATRRGARAPQLALVATVLFLGVLALPGALDAQIIVSGTLQDPFGVGIPGADIDVTSLGGTSLSLSGDITGVGGSFSFTILQGPGDPPFVAGLHDIQFNPQPGHLGDTFTVSLASGSQNIGTFTLDSGFIISGTIIDSDGFPVPGIDIDMQLSGGGGGTAVDLSGDTSGPNGVFQLTMPTQVGIYDFTFTPPAPPNPPTGCGTINPTANPNCTLGVFPIEILDQQIFGDFTFPNTIVMPTASCVSGFLVNDLGQPLVGFDTQAFDAATGATIDLIQDDTDCNGFFNVLVPNGTVDLVFRMVLPIPPPVPPPTVHYVPVRIPDLVIDGPIDLGTLTAFPGFNVTGTVTRANGVTPIANAEIEVLDAITGELIYESEDLTDLLGQFTYLVPSGDWIVEVDPSPLLATTVVPQLFPLTVSGAPVSMGTLALPDGATISGRAVNAAAPTQGVPFIDIEFEDSITQLPVEALHENGNATGNFSATLEPGSYDVLLLPALGSGFAPAEVPTSIALGAPSALGDIPLGPGVGLSGQVVAGGVPVSGAEVVVGGAIPYDNVSDLTGNFGFQIAPGTVSITVVPPLGSPHPTLVLPATSVMTDTFLTLDLLAAPSAVTGLSCTPAGTEVTLTWSSGNVQGETITILRDGLMLTSLPGSTTSFLDTAVPVGGHDYSVIANRAGTSAAPATCTVLVGGGGGLFIRGRVVPPLTSPPTIGDAIAILGYLFSGTSLPCLDAADVDDGGSVNIGDAIGLLTYLFAGGAPPPPPFPNPGTDPTPDPLGCN